MAKMLARLRSNGGSSRLDFGIRERFVNINSACLGGFAIAACTVFGRFIVSAAEAADPAAPPPNRWVEVADEKSGGTIGEFVYVPGLGGMLLYGYPAESTSHEVSLFRTAQREWSGQVKKGPHQSRGSVITRWAEGRPMLPVVNRTYWLAGQCCYVPTEGKVLYFAGGSTFSYEPQAKRWENLEIPLHEAPPDVMLGSMAWDPVGKRVILFGGGYISAYKGDRADSGSTGKPLGDPWSPMKWWSGYQRATWAFDPAKAAWSEVATGSKAFRNIHAEAAAFDQRMIDLLALARGIALRHDRLLDDRKPAETPQIARSIAADAEKLAARLAEGGGCADQYEAARCREAAGILRTACASLDAVASALPEIDGWRAYRSAEKARWEFHEAAEAVAPSPLPRYYAGFVTDTENGALVLFGGHGGNRALADTWIFDGAKDQWRKSGSAAHPPFDAMPTLSFDSDAGQSLLVARNGGWLYDAKADAWRMIKLDAAKDAFHPWISVEYDPERKVHVAMSAAHSTYGSFGPRKTALLKLDASQAEPAEDAGPTWKWLNDKYDASWAALPADDAEYDKRLAAQRKFLDELPANTWVKLSAPYDAQNRGYGSFCYDHDRNQVVNWGGGHSAYMGNEFSHYDVKSNLWLESWAPDLPPWPFGAPDGDGWNPAMHHRKGSAHGYHHYVYNDELQRIVFYGGAVIYDPVRMQWTGERIKRQGPGAIGYTVDPSGTSHLMTASAQYYRGSPFGVWRADLEKMTLARIAGSDPHFGSNDRAKPVFDSKRNRILWYGCHGQSPESKTDNELYAFPLEAGKWTKIEPKVEPAGAAAPAMKAWGNSYSPRHDVLMILPGDEKQDMWMYDPATNVLRNAGPGPEAGRSGTCGVIYDPHDDVFIAMEVGSYGVGPVSLHYYRNRPAK